MRGQILGNCVSALRTGAAVQGLVYTLYIWIPTCFCSVAHPEEGKGVWVAENKGIEWKLGPPHSSLPCLTVPAARPGQPQQWLGDSFLEKSNCARKKCSRSWNVRVPHWKSWHLSTSITWSSLANNSAAHTQSLQSAFRNSLLNRIGQPRIPVLLGKVSTWKKGPKQTRKEKPYSRCRYSRKQKKLIFFEKSYS